MTLSGNIISGWVKGARRRRRPSGWMSGAPGRPRRSHARFSSRKAWRGAPQAHHVGLGHPTDGPLAHDVAACFPRRREPRAGDAHAVFEDGAPTVSGLRGDGGQPAEEPLEVNCRAVWPKDCCGLAVTFRLRDVHTGNAG